MSSRQDPQGRQGSPVCRGQEVTLLPFLQEVAFLTRGFSMRTPACIIPAGQTGHHKASMLSLFVKVTTTTHSAWSGCKPTTGHISLSLAARLKLHEIDIAQSAMWHL
ncbi:hypothetical protein PGTUg99_006160 [Puccinia graminis f. sp. tritici]|uniref:Uncharacterized protein n=1 Tax=Puccinia graminis f. sp. tritici TaxID=56615 RepID=A0A5B0RDB5_PUCGR|nr:hypothetical protein PGTUg99_006160 [Puccinia graminis f. sp. tritici]